MITYELAKQLKEAGFKQTGKGENKRFFAGQPISDEVVADVDVNDNQTFEDTASDLLKIHASKIDNLTQYINDSVNISL